LLWVSVHRRRVQAIASFSRRIGQSFWTLRNGQAIHRRDVDDRVKNIDERTGRRRVLKGKVHLGTGRDSSASSWPGSHIFRDFRKPGAPPDLAQIGSRTAAYRFEQTK
jgi:hypothetical protein